jgi:hypothetical protein
MLVRQRPGLLTLDHLDQGLSRGRPGPWHRARVGQRGRMLPERWSDLTIRLALRPRNGAKKESTWVMTPKLPGS